MPRKGQGRITGQPKTNEIPQPAGGVRLETFVPWTLVKRGAKKQVVTPLDAPEALRVETAAARRAQEVEKDPPRVKALGLAHYWQHLLDSGKFGSLTEIAAAEALDMGQVSRIVRLAQLAPDVVADCIAGEADDLALEQLIRRAIPFDWGKQSVGFLSSKQTGPRSVPREAAVEVGRQNSKPLHTPDFERAHGNST